MPPPVSQAAKFGKFLKKTGDLTKAIPHGEVEERLSKGFGHADIAKAFPHATAEEIRNRIASARRANPALKADPRLRRMEANWIIENGMNNGQTWDEISGKLDQAGFNGKKLSDAAAKKWAAGLMGASPVAFMGQEAEGQQMNPHNRGLGIPQRPLDTPEDIEKAQQALDAARQWRKEQDAETKRLNDESDERIRRLEEAIKRMEETGRVPRVPRVTGSNEEGAPPDLPLATDEVPKPNNDAKAPPKRPVLERGEPPPTAPRGQRVPQTRVPTRNY